MCLELREKVFDDGAPFRLHDELQVFADPACMPQVPSQRALCRGMCEALQCTIQPTQHTAEAMEQCGRVRFDLGQDSPRHVGKQSHKMCRASGSGYCGDLLTCRGYAQLL